MAVILACSRFRARDFKLLAVVRRISALCLARNVRCHFRWVPSEFNAADAVSRIFDPSDEADQTLVGQLESDDAVAESVNVFSVYFNKSGVKLRLNQ